MASKTLLPVQDLTTDLTTVLVLPRGQVVVAKDLDAATFFKFVAQAAKKGASAACQWAVLQMFEIDGKPITIDDLHDEAGIGFEGAAMLISEVSKQFETDDDDDEDGKPQDGEAIALSCGRTATRKPLPGRDFFRFQELSTKDTGRAIRWVVQRMFLLDGEPIADAMLDGQPPDSLSFRDLSQLNSEISQLFKAAPTLKT